MHTLLVLRSEEQRRSDWKKMKDLCVPTTTTELVIVVKIAIEFASSRIQMEWECMGVICRDGTRRNVAFGSSVADALEDEY